MSEETKDSVEADIIRISKIISTCFDSGNAEELEVTGMQVSKALRTIAIAYGVLCEAMGVSDENWGKPAEATQVFSKQLAPIFFPKE